MDDDIQAIDPPTHVNGSSLTSQALSHHMPDPETTSGVPVGISRQVTQVPQSKYAQLLAVIEDMGKDIRPTYAGSKSSAERLKRGIVHARILVRECLLETERSARQ